MAKSLKKNYLFNVSYQVLAIISPIITTPYISRILGPAGVGKFNYVYAIAYIFSLLCLYGTNIYGQREIAYVQKEPEKQNQVFWEIVMVKMIAFIITSVLYWLIVISLDAYSLSLFCSYTYVVASFFDISWLFQGLEDFKKTVVRNSVIKLVGILLVFCLVKQTTDVEIYIIILGGTTLLGQVYMWFCMPSYIKWNKKLQLSIKRHLKPCLVLLIPSIATYIYTSLDKVMLGIYTSDVEVGVFSQAEKIVKLVMTIVTSLGVVLIPKMANLIKEQEWKKVVEYFEKSFKFVTYLSLPMVIGISSVANCFIPLFLGDGYDECIVLVQILSPLIFIIGIASITGQAVLVSMNKQIYYTMTVVLGAVINCIINVWLVPNIHYYGASIATLVAEGFVMAMQLYGIRKLIHLKSIARSNYKCIIACLLMFFSLELLEQLPDVNIWVELIMKIVIGILVYVLSLLILKEKYVTGFCEKVKIRLKQVID